tara:strand:- start:75 stop:524 length:450 start_codon:yes stop_codon:yes gene_type:complete
MNLPTWVKDFIKDKRCPYCDEKIKSGIVECLGIKILDGGLAGLFFESRCPHCDKVSQTILQTEQGFNPAELAAEIYNGLDDHSELSYYEYEIDVAPKGADRSYLKREDIEEMKEFLKKNNNYIDFLYYIGCSDEEIENHAGIKLWEDDE